MPTWAPMPAASPPLPQRASSSASTASWRCPPPCPPYSSGYFSPRKPTPASLAKTSSGNQRSASHCSAWGRSSAAMKRRIESRSCSCSSVNGGVAGIAARTYLDTGRYAWYTGLDVLRSVEQTSIHTPQLYERIASRLAEDVRSGALAPGERLPGERELARRLGVGRSSVREAIAALQVDGVVVTRPGSGTYVADAPPVARGEDTAADVSPSALLEARALVEPRIAALAAQRAGQGGRDAESERLLDAMESGALPWNDADRLFHLRLAELTANPVLAALAGQISD